MDEIHDFLEKYSSEYRGLSENLQFFSPIKHYKEDGWRLAIAILLNSEGNHLFREALNTYTEVLKSQE